jgi:hypothetical protein
MKFEGALALEFLFSKKKIVPILVFFRSQEAVNKIWSKNRIFSGMDFPSFWDS